MAAPLAGLVIEKKRKKRAEDSEPLCSFTLQRPLHKGPGAGSGTLNNRYWRLFGAFSAHPAVLLVTVLGTNNLANQTARKQQDWLLASFAN
jgi:hypothetical protein